MPNSSMLREGLPEFFKYNYDGTHDMEDGGNDMFDGGNKVNIEVVSAAQSWNHTVSRTTVVSWYLSPWT